MDTAIVGDMGIVMIKAMEVIMGMGMDMDMSMGITKNMGTILALLMNLLRRLKGLASRFWKVYFCTLLQTLWAA